VSRSTEPFAEGHTMTERKLKTVRPRLEVLVAQDRDLLKALVKEALDQLRRSRAPRYGVLQSTGMAAPLHKRPAASRLKQMEAPRRKWTGLASNRWHERLRRHGRGCAPGGGCGDSDARPWAQRRGSRPPSAGRSRTCSLAGPAHHVARGRKGFDCRYAIAFLLILLE
jgi:hypothetical protein